MRNIILTIVIFTTFGYGAFCQNQKPTFSSNPSLSFEKFISGVKYAEIGLTPTNQEQVDVQTGISGLYYLAQNYLLQLGFEYVALTSAEKTELAIELDSYCEYTMVLFGGDIDKKTIANMTISFVSCNGDVFSFSSDKKFVYRKFSDVEKKLIEDWKSIHNNKGTYKPANQLRLPSNPTNWTKDKLMSYYEDNAGKLAPIEGIYDRVRLSLEDVKGGKYTVGVLKNPKGEGYLVIYLSGAKNATDWKSGELKAVLNSTATKGFYSVDWISRDKSLFEDVYCNIDGLGFSVYATGVQAISYKFIKILPIN